jgi:chromate transporter
VTGAAAAGARAPRSCGELFCVFNRLALRGFGGVLPVAHYALVEEEHWLAPQEFVELLALAQVLPGPNVVNMALIYGDRQFGWRGALAACAGLLALPLAIVLVLVAVYHRYEAHPLVRGALRGMGAVAAGLVISTAVKLAPTLRGNPLGPAAGALLALATLVGVGFLRWPMLWVVMGLGGIGMALAWRGLRA